MDAQRLGLGRQLVGRAGDWGKRVGKMVVGGSSKDWMPFCLVPVIAGMAALSAGR